METTKGKLYLIPSPLGEIDFSHIFPTYNSEIIQHINHFIVEDLRTGRRFIKKLGMEKPMEGIEFLFLNEHTKPREYAQLLAPCLAGHDVGMLSDAGTPCVADPGNVVVALAQKHDVEVVPLVGPNSILLGLMGSGLNGQQFAFNGYLPREQKGREIQLIFHEKLMLRNKQTQIFIETPYRNNHFFQSMLNVCKSETKICLAIEVASENQSIITKTVREWKKVKIDIHKRPTVFLMGVTS